MRFKTVLVVTTAVVLVAAAVANAFSGGESPKDALEAKAQRIEERLLSGGPALASARRGKRGARGPAGPKGPQGPAGAAGPKGSFGAISSVLSPVTQLCTFSSGVCAVGSAHAECPAGTSVISGGWNGLTIDSVVSFSERVGNGWSVIAINWSEGFVANLQAQAVCASP
jgi:hypothetical protein